MVLPASSSACGYKVSLVTLVMLQDSKIEQEYDTAETGFGSRDTTYGFYRIYDFNASISASTTLYGFYKPLPFLGNKVEMIRHRFEPSITVSAQPGLRFFSFAFIRPMYIKTRMVRIVNIRILRSLIICMAFRERENKEISVLT